jgi:hypothetical protein
LTILALLGGALLSPQPGWAGEADYDPDYKHSDGAGMIIDGIVVRPVSFVVTVLGMVFFVVTVPFAALGGNVDEAWDNMVEAPANYTFSRCLGCWPRGL